MDYESEAPQRFRGIGFAAGWAAAITVICLLIGQSAEQYAKVTAPANNSTVLAANIPKFGAVDNTPTGAIKGQTPTLSPCGPYKAAP